MKTNVLVAFAVTCMLSAVASAAAPVLNIGSHELVEDMSGQTIQLYVIGTDQVTSFNLRGQIGDGSGQNPEPVFESIGFGGGMWDTYSNTVVGGPIGGSAQLAQAYVAFDTTVSVPADGLLVTLTVDTTGFFDGDSFALLFKDSEIGADSDFVVSGGGVLDPDITNGTINIVPEPTSMVMLGGCGLLALRRRKR